jgi:hypothetical protein
MIDVWVAADDTVHYLHAYDNYLWYRLLFRQWYNYDYSAMADATIWIMADVGQLIISLQNWYSDSEPWNRLTDYMLLNTDLLFLDCLSVVST